MFKNGIIVTMQGSKIAEAMIVKDDLIYDLGTNKYITKKYKNMAKSIVDLKGKTVIPGLNDAHLHLYQYALAKSKLNLSGVKTISDIKTKMEKHIVKFKLQKDDWIEGYGWNENLFPERKPFQKSDLDNLSKENPIFFKRQCFHVAIANSKALELAKINKNTVDPEGGTIGRDENAIPNGLVYDEAINLIEKCIPEKQVFQMKELYKDAFKDLYKAGFTSVQCDDFINIDNPENILKAYQELRKENKIPLRVNLQMRLNTVEKIRDFAKRNLVTSMGDDFFRLGPVKIITDGSLDARTAALIEPYEDDPSTRGTLLYKDEALDKLVLEAYKNNYQVAVHAIGDRALRSTLEAYRKAKELTNKKNRPVIIHVQIGNEEIYDKMKELNVIATVQPVFVKSDWPVCEKRVGKKRGHLSYAWKTLMDKGVKVAGSSDAPIEPFDPMLNIYTAVTRKDTEGRPENGWHSEQRLSVMQALELFTTNAAYASFDEKIKGDLSSGKLADFIVLSDNITSIEPDKIKEIEVLNTYIGGREVYRKNDQE